MLIRKWTVVSYTSNVTRHHHLFVYYLSAYCLFVGEVGTQRNECEDKGCRWVEHKTAKSEFFSKQKASRENSRSKKSHNAKYLDLVASQCNTTV